MNKEQFSEHIGNIDDRLVKQAEQIPNYAAMRRKKGFRQLWGIAAALVLYGFRFRCRSDSLCP